MRVTRARYAGVVLGRGGGVTGLTNGCGGKLCAGLACDVAEACGAGGDGRGLGVGDGAGLGDGPASGRRSRHGAGVGVAAGKRESIRSGIGSVK